MYGLNTLFRSVLFDLFRVLPVVLEAGLRPELINNISSDDGIMLLVALLVFVPFQIYCVYLVYSVICEINSSPGEVMNKGAEEE